MNTLQSGICLLLGLQVAAIGEEGEVDLERVRQMWNKRRDGGIVTKADSAYLEQFDRWDRIKNEAFRQAHPPSDSTGLEPLTDLAEATYKRREGGLYPGGQNLPPPFHLEAGIQRAQGIVPVDQEGHPTPEGKVVLLSIGMSNTMMEFRAFMALAREDGQLNPCLLMVNGAQGGQSAEVTADSSARFWRVVNRRLTKAGATANQVKVRVDETGHSVAHAFLAVPRNQ